MRPDPRCILSLEDVALVMYVGVDDALRSKAEQHEHQQAKLSLSELVTIGLMFSLKGGSFRRFYLWLVANLGDCFPHLPERTRLQRRLLQYQALVVHFLAEPSLFCVADSYGIELRHPIREFQEPQGERIGAKGKSNKRWIHGMKLLLVINDQDQVVSFDWATANVADKHFNALFQQFNQQAIMLVDLGFRDKDKSQVPACLKFCAHKTWSERMSIERLLSQLTRFFGAKKRNHRTELGFTAWWAYLIIAINLIAASPDLCIADIVL